MPSVVFCLICEPEHDVERKQERHKREATSQKEADEKQGAAEVPRITFGACQSEAREHPHGIGCEVKHYGNGQQTIAPNPARDIVQLDSDEHERRGEKDGSEDFPEGTVAIFGNHRTVASGLIVSRVS